MNFSTLDGQLKSARRARNAMTFISAALLTVVLLLAVKIYSSSNQVVLMPSMPADGMVARGNVDRSYIEALAKDAVFALYNASPGTRDYGRAVIERVAAPKYRAALLDQYDSVAQDMAERKVSTVFTIYKLEHSDSRLEVVVSGENATYLETTLIARQERRVYLKFVKQAGSVRLSKIGLLEKEKS